MAGLMTRKPVAEILASGEADGPALSRSLGPLSITAMGIGAIIGAGIFVLTGTAAARYAGPGIMLSFVLGGVACTFVALCYAELAAMLPVSGSVYTYTYVTLGEIFAWIIGWDLVLEYAMGAATVSVGWSGYFTSLLGSLGIAVSPTLVAAPGTAVTLADGSTASAIVNLPAAAIVLLLTVALLFGVRDSARLNNTMVALKLVVVAAFIAIGVAYVDPAHWRPFVPPNAGEFGHFGASGLLRGASVVFFAFLGFDAVSTAAQEARHPQRDMPIGILASLAISTLLYIAVAAVLTGLVPYADLDVADPIARGVDVIGFPWLAVVVKIGALAGLTTVVLVLLFGQSRISFTMARDGLLPGLFARVHPRLQTPWLSQLIVGGFVALLAALLPIGILGEMVSIGTLFAFVLVCASVIWLRRVDPAVPRPFRVPGVPVLPGLGILLCLLLMAGLPGATWLRLLVWLLIGLGLYFGYGRSHSRLRAGGTVSLRSS